LKIVSVVGARPQFVKLAAISKAIKEFDIQHLIINTGQHYDLNMSDIFFEGLDIPSPDFNLKIGSASHGIQTGSMMAALDPIFKDINPDWVLVFGDTNSTLAAAINAAKFQIPVAHLEAGLRSFNKKMPEEHNRVLTDHASDLLLAPSEIAMKNLKIEGLSHKAKLVGDVMTDICLMTRDLILKSKDLDSKNSNKFLATLHRAENTDNPAKLKEILKNLQESPAQIELLAHPRLIAKAKEFDIKLESGSLIISEPVSYQKIIELVLTSKGVITDSGGLQKEAYILGKLCTTLRTETEWVETLVDGWNVLDPLGENLSENLNRDLPTKSQIHYYGEGNASKMAIQEIFDF
jgi:UDP-N-acetylglucosamine 2-epimerase (non-hydrolysing)